MHVFSKVRMEESNWAKQQLKTISACALAKQARTCDSGTEKQALQRKWLQKTPVSQVAPVRWDSFFFFYKLPHSAVFLFFFYQREHSTLKSQCLYVAIISTLDMKRRWTHSWVHYFGEM